jgi:hypothetical protein
MGETVRHPTRNQSFTRLDTGLVLVEDHDSQTSGTFKATGQWVEGELRFADVHLLEWVGRPE